MARLYAYKCIQAEDGKEKIVTPNGEVLSGELVGAGTQDATGVGYISHFATCPNAASHRKK